MEGRADRRFPSVTTSLTISMRRLAMSAAKTEILAGSARERNENVPKVW